MRLNNFTTFSPSGLSQTAPEGLRRAPSGLETSVTTAVPLSVTLEVEGVGAVSVSVRDGVAEGLGVLPAVGVGGCDGRGVFVQRGLGFVTL